MELSHLPGELFTIVIDYATDRGSDLRALCNFSLVSRRWHAALNHRIYSKWLYDGEHHSISSLWQFLRSVLSSRCIADSVHELDIRNWTFGLVHGRRRLFLSEDDLDLVRNAVRAAGLERIETSVLEALPKADPRPLVALLLANLRNLAVLYAQLPETDIFLDEVLRKAVESERDRPLNDYPLHGLREAHLASSWNYRAFSFRPKPQTQGTCYKLGINRLWPVLRLPNIQRLSVFDLEPLGASALFGDSPNTSSITDLTLVCHGDSLVAVPDGLALLALPKALTNLSIYVDDCGLAKDGNQLSNADLWHGILQHENSLEYLDLYRSCNVCEPPHHNGNNSCFGSMRGFKRLKRLSIQPEALLGDCRQRGPAPFHLRDTLPRNLQSLTFYNDDEMGLDKTRSRELQDVIADTDFPRLGHVALEETPRHFRSRFNDFLEPPNEEVERACKQHGREYETKPASCCTKGGRGCRYYRQVTERRKEMEGKMVGVKFAVTEYLSRLEGGLAFKDRFLRGPRLDLSSDDLDTYELPWDELAPEVLYPNEGDDWD